MHLFVRDHRFHSNPEHHMVTLAPQHGSPQGASLRPALPAPRRPDASRGPGGRGVPGGAGAA